MPHRRKINWFGILFWLLIIVIFTASVLLVISYRKNKSPETPSVEIGDTSMSDDHTDTQDETAGTDTKLPTGTVTDDTAQGTEEEDSKPEEEEKQEEEKSEEEEN